MNVLSQGEKLTQAQECQPFERFAQAFTAPRYILPYKIPSPTLLLNDYRIKGCRATRASLAAGAMTVDFKALLK